MKPTRTIVLAALACAVAGAAAVAQQKVSGEKWRMKMSMQAEGFSMPARTMEMCLPQAEPQKAMMQQQQQQGEGNCAVTNFQQSGNKTSADIRCTGKDAMEGRVEMEQLSPTSTRGVMTGRTADTSMRMEYEYTKLGGACEAVDYSNYKPPAVAAVPQIDYCQRMFDDLEKGGALSGTAVSMVQQYPNADGRGTSDCSKHANFPKFCSAVQTPAGFADLDHEQWNRRSLPAGRNEDAGARMVRTPLTESLKLCKLDASAGGIQKLQKQMATAARSSGQYGFALYYDAAEQYPELQELAKKECSGRSFTNAANTQYLGLCRNYGSALVRNDRPAVLEAAGCNQEREDVGRGVCIGATGDGGTGAAAMIGTASSGGASGGSSGSAAPATAEAAEAEEPASAKDKAKDALDKGRKALRGIFGGG